MIHTAQPNFSDPNTWRARADRAAARIERAKSPERMIIESVRAGMAAVDSAIEDARRDHDEANKPVSSPLPALVHADVAAKVAAFLADEGIDNPLLSIGGETLDQRIQRYQDAARVRADEATRAMREFEVEQARERVALAMKQLADVEALARPVPVVETETIAQPETLSDDQPVIRRPRGRPSIVEDDCEPVRPE